MLQSDSVFILRRNVHVREMQGHLSESVFIFVSSVIDMIVVFEVHQKSIIIIRFEVVVQKL